MINILNELRIIMKVFDIINELSMPAFTAKGKAMKSGRKTSEHDASRILNHVHLSMGKAGIDELTFSYLQQFLRTSRYKNLVRDPAILKILSVSNTEEPTVDLDNAPNPNDEANARRRELRAKKKAEAARAQEKRNKINARRRELRAKKRADNVTTEDIQITEAVGPDTVITKDQLKQIVLILAQKANSGAAETDNNSELEKQAAEVLKKAGITGITVTAT